MNVGDSPGHSTAIGQPAADATGYDSELRRLDRAFRSSCGFHVDDHVLDVGCGDGSTTRAAARAAHEGSALGVDISAWAIGRARSLADVEGVRNVVFECADVQRHQFPPGGFDVAVSRFGTMFFEDAGAAFLNIARALRPAGRLVMMVWQAGDRNEWDVAIRESLDGVAGPVVLPAGSAAFSLADPSETGEMLRAVGFVDIGFVDVDEPVYYGPDVESALAWVRGFTCTRDALERLDPEGSERAVTKLREMLSAHLRSDGVWFGSRSWIVTARRG